MEKLYTTSNFFNHPYYWVAKFVAELCGLWPYRTTLQNICRLIPPVTFLFQYTFQISGAIHYRHRREVLLAALPIIVVDIMSSIKYVNAVYNWKKLKDLLERIKEDWDIVQDEEKKILEKYAQIGQYLATGYTVIVYAGVVLFDFEPRLSAEMGVLLISNFTKPEKNLLYPAPMYFGYSNIDKYDPLLSCFSYFSCLAIMTIVISNDILFIILLQHICGRFSGLGHSIRSLPISKKGSEDVGFEYICQCIISHNRILTFCDIIESLFVWSFLGVLGSSMMMLSITGVQLVLGANTLQAIAKLTMFGILQIIRLFFECFMSQQLINHSSYIRTCIDDSMWYDSSKKVKKIIIFMLMRSQIPSRLTAGKVIEMSMETFSSILKSSASYFTVFLSMQ